MRSQVNCNCG